MRDITIGQYFPGNSIIHQLDPRTKILSVLAFIVAVFIIKNIVLFAVYMGFIIAIAMTARIPFKALLNALKPIQVLLIVLFLLNLLFTHTGNTLWSFWILEITDEGIYNAVFLTFRLIVVLLGTSLLTFTTTPIALTDGLERLLKPLSIVKFPAHELAMMMTIALRFIPALLEETDKITKAQLSRGADIESGNLLKRAKSMIPILVPLFVGAIRRADDLAMAMESRCYHGGEGRTRMSVMRFQRKDGVAVLVILCLIVLAVVVP